MYKFESFKTKINKNQSTETKVLFKANKMIYTYMQYIRE